MSIKNNKSISSISSGTDESKRQDSIQELIVTEENYMTDMNIVKEVSCNKLD